MKWFDDDLDESKLSEIGLRLLEYRRQKRIEMRNMNKQIKAEYKQGVTLRALGVKYKLSHETIRNRIKLAESEPND